MSPHETREVTIKRLPVPHRGRRWRWDVVIHEPIDQENPGVYNCRRHIGREFGYTRTWLGAALTVAQKATAGSGSSDG